MTWNMRRIAFVAVGGILLASHVAQREIRAVVVRSEKPTAALADNPTAAEAAEAVVTAAGAIAIPVLGIEKSALRDTWGEARSGSRKHAAIDILAPRGTPVVAAEDGIVVKIFESRAGGLTMYLADPSGENLWYYAHLDRYAAGLEEGDEVARGTVLGYVGTTGNAPPSVPHLHLAFERLPPGGEWWKGIPENPYPMLVARGFTVR